MNADTASTIASETNQPVLGAGTRLGSVHLTVNDLDRSVAFYETSIGLRLRERTPTSAALGAGGEDILVLTEQPGARRAGHHSGLYHVAVLHPSRLELARAVLRLAATRTMIDGASDHTISEAIYLSDPDGNGLELAADRSRDQWPDMSSAPASAMVQPLDLNSLVSLAAGEEVTPHVDPATIVGHVHLYVGDIEAGTRFYRDLLGFEVQMALPGAMFVSAGGYHHHVGFNTWRGNGIAPQPPGVVGFGYWTIVVATRGELLSIEARLRAAGVETREHEDGVMVRDPAGIAVLIRAEH